MKAEGLTPLRQELLADLAGAVVEVEVGARAGLGPGAVSPCWAVSSHGSGNAVTAVAELAETAR